MEYPKRIFDILSLFEKNPQTIGRMVISEKINGQWIKYNTQQYIDFSNKLASALIEIGLQKGDKVATITNNRPQWNFVDMAILLAGGVHVTVYPTISDDEFKYILQHSDSKFVFVSNQLLYNKISQICSDIPTVIDIFTFDKIEGVTNWQDLVEFGNKTLQNNLPIIENFKQTIDEDDLATLLYTSGTTGTPKGVMLSHKNILHVSIESSKIMNINHNHKVLDFLPLSHIFGHMTNYIYQILGISIFYAENVAKIADNINELQVDGFITVPRLLEAIYEKIELKAQKLPWIKRKIFEWSIKIGEKYTPYGNNLFYNIKHKIADALVYKQWRKALSPNVKFLGCGGSALSPRLGRLFWAAGFRVFEGYGLTETSPIIAVNYDQKGKIKIGTVGPILNGVEYKIADDGEILVKGPNLMLGYYKNAEATSDVIDNEGWFKTGDIGFVDDEGFLHITDRKKEIFKLSNGKYIAPQKLENKLKESFLINQVVVLGENEKYPVALISPNIDFFAEWMKKQNLHIDKNNVHECLTLKEKIKKEIEKINKKLSEHEKIRNFAILKEELSIAKGELSSTLKLKRQVIVNKYRQLINELYKKN